MATATGRTATVEKVIYVPEERYTIDLSREEAQAILAVAHHVAGPDLPGHPRHDFAAVGKALSAVGVTRSPTIYSTGSLRLDK